MLVLRFWCNKIRCRDSKNFKGMNPSLKTIGSCFSFLLWVHIHQTFQEEQINASPLEDVWGGRQALLNCSVIITCSSQDSWCQKKMCLIKYLWHQVTVMEEFVPSVLAAGFLCHLYWNPPLRHTGLRPRPSLWWGGLLSGEWQEK